LSSESLLASLLTSQMRSSISGSTKPVESVVEEKLLALTFSASVCPFLRSFGLSANPIEVILPGYGILGRHGEIGGFPARLLQSGRPGEYFTCRDFSVDGTGMATGESDGRIRQ